MVEAALAAEVGKLVGPVYLEEAERYAVLRVIERQESRIRPFDEARKSVRHALGVEQSNMLVSSLFQSVREKYEDRVVIFDDLLEQRHSNQ